MLLRRVCIAIASLATGAGICLAEPPSREALDAYLETTNSSEVVRASCLRFADELTPDDETYCAREWDEEGPLVPGSATDYERNLIIALAEESSPTDVIARFARFSDRSTSEAELIANLLLETADALDSCIEAGTTPDCVPTENTDLVELILGAAAIDRDGSLLVRVDGSLDLPAILLPVVDQLPSSHGVLKALRDRFNYTQDFRYIVVSTYHGDIDDSILQSAFTREPRDVSRLEQFAYFQFLFERLDESQRFSDTGLLLTALRLRTALDLGLSREARAIWSTLDNQQRQRMWLRVSQSHIGASETHRSRGQIHRLLVDLAANSLLLGDVNQCDELLASAASVAELSEADRQIVEEASSQNVYRPYGDRISAPAYDDVVEFLQEYMVPTMSARDVYDVFVTGSPGPSLSMERSGPGGATDGWLWSFRASSPDVRTLAAAYVEARGYATLGDFLRTLRRPTYAHNNVALELNSPEFELVLDSIARPTEQQVAATESDAASISRLNVFVEETMPAEYRREGDPRARLHRPPPGELSYPVEPWQIVRWEREDELVRIIYQSTELDPAGEISGGGYWFAESPDGGITWDGPLYLGLQQYFPYVVLPQSSMPLVENDRLQIAVAVRALDPNSISFPPVGVSILREEEGVYISAPLQDLRRDQDGDGLTDIYEHRIGLDMRNADSDGDGLPDALDGLPLTAFNPDKIEDAEIARIMLEPIIGHEANALMVPLTPDSQSLGEMLEAMARAAEAPNETRSTLILRGDPSLFSGLASRSRIIIYNDEMIERISPEYGVFYPVGFPTVLPNHDRSQLYVIWSAGWAGGEFYIYRNAQGEFEVEVTSSWVT